MTQRLQKILQDYLRYHRIEGSTEATVKFYAKELRLFLKDLDPACQTVADLTRFHVLEHLSAMRERGLKPRSIRTRWQAITTWLNWCVAWGLIGSSPASQIKAPKVPKIRKPFMTPEQFASLLDLCPLNTFAGARRQSMLWMLATTGIRRNEMWMLTVKDLNWETSVIRVIYGKGQKERQVPFDRQCQRAMLRYMQQRSDSLHWLWVTEEGIRLGYDGIWKDLKRAPRGTSGGASARHLPHLPKNLCGQRCETKHTPAIRNGHCRLVVAQMLDYYVTAMEAEEGAMEAFREFKLFGR